MFGAVNGSTYLAVALLTTSLHVHQARQARSYLFEDELFFLASLEENN